LTALQARVRMLCTLLLSISLTAIPQFGAHADQPVTPVALFLGDSYSVGTGAGKKGLGFTTLTANAMNWREVNMAQGGTGYAAQYRIKGQLHISYLAVLETINLQPDIVIVSGGRNDQWNKKTISAISAFFVALHATFPNAQLIATSPIWDAQLRPPAKMARLKVAVKSAAEANGVSYINLGEPLSGHRNLLTRDRVHPNALGHAAIADKLISELRALQSQ